MCVYACVGRQSERAELQVSDSGVGGGLCFSVAGEHPREGDSVCLSVCVCVKLSVCGNTVNCGGVYKVVS